MLENCATGKEWTSNFYLFSYFRYIFTSMFICPQSSFPLSLLVLCCVSWCIITTCRSEIWCETMCRNVYHITCVVHEYKRKENLNRIAQNTQLRLFCHI